ncbi:hypothetical protein [uncultured Actinomyces sp.]|uniref:hypothetical protein n=1 Tax=uncultured Actinomyces sp. TaxID=249061 RepID=UPI0028D13C96|nr:hypothetical protein [uncultured Actinomyces sp.]
MSDQEHKEDVDKVTEETDHPHTGEETPLTGEEVTLPGEASAAEDIIGGASVTETSQVEPVHMGVTPTSVDDALAQRSTSEHSEAEPESAQEQQDAQTEESSSDEPSSEESSQGDSHDLAHDENTVAESEHTSHDDDAEPASEKTEETTEDNAEPKDASPEESEEAPDSAHTTTIPAASEAAEEEPEDSPSVTEVPDALSRRTPAQPETAEEPEDEIESTQVRRRAFIAPAAESATTEASWKPREDSGERTVPQETPESLDDALFEGATVVPEMPSRAAAHWSSLALGIFALPITWYLIADAGARMTLPEGNPAATGVVNWLALTEVAIAFVAVIALFEAFKRSSLGAWIGGLCFFAAGLPWVFAPGFTSAHTVSVLHFLQNSGALGANLAHHLQASGYSGRLLFLGIALLGIASLSHSVRRRGRNEEAMREQVERVNPTGAHFTARERRRAEKAAGLR